MKKVKKFTALFLVLSLSVSIFAFSASAATVSKDPNFDFHMQISTHIDELRNIRDAKIEPLQKQIEDYQQEAMSLFEEKSQYSVTAQNTYDIIVNNIAENEVKIDAIKNEYFNNIKNYLSSMGFDEVEETNLIETEDKTIHTSATDVGKMQSTSSVTYNKTKNEFYYLVEYDYNAKNILGSYLGLNDAWGTYDLVSMQHRDERNWSWNNIIVTANLAYGFYGNSLVGKADKYEILDTGLAGTSAVSNREDFWNGCVFNVKDTEVSGPQNFSSEIRYVTVEGWLKPSGTVKSTAVKSEYEHNYKTKTATVSVDASTLDNGTFGMKVEYSSTIGTWRRSAGSKTCTIS